MMYSLHATQYPWEHEKYLKTFDHQGYALARIHWLTCSPNLDYAVASRSTEKSAPHAIHSTAYPGDHSSAPPTPSLR